MGLGIFLYYSVYRHEHKKNSAEEIAAVKIYMRPLLEWSISEKREEQDGD